jgi:predicted nucleic acid-binding protein
MANLVLDASAVIRIIDAADSSASFQEAVLKADLVLAPELMLTEVANALWKLQRAGQLVPEGVQLRLSRAAELVDVIDPTHICKLKHWLSPAISIIRSTTACIWLLPGEKWRCFLRLTSACSDWQAGYSSDHSPCSL